MKKSVKSISLFLTVFFVLGVGAAISLLIGFTALSTEARAQTPDRFTCRASALRVDLVDTLGLGLFVEPVVANDPEDPCKEDASVILNPDLSEVNSSAMVLFANTDKPADAEAGAVDVDFLGLVSAAVLVAEAHVRNVGGQCALEGSSLVGSAVVAGQPVNVDGNHLEIPIPGVATVHFNETIIDPSGNRITQRALWLEINSPLLGTGEVVVGEATADFEGNPCPPPPSPDRMTGGGSVFNDGRVTHGFVLHCNAEQGPNNLQVNWGNGNKFHLEMLTEASCSNAPDIDEGQPAAGFDTYDGSGMGHYNGVPGATAEWTFTDAGEPGKNDTAKIVIKDVLGNVVLEVEGKLQSGNHQAH